MATKNPTLSHFTLDGRPLCDCSATAYRERFAAAFNGNGIPVCEDKTPEQLARFAALAEQFPGRVALVHGDCPNTTTENQE